ncbi:hypothetical protein ACLKA6_003247 [Drosophila palustris]
MCPYPRIEASSLSERQCPSLCYELLVSLGAAPAGSSVLRESPIPGPQFIAIDNSTDTHNSCNETDFTTLQENSTAINKTNNKRIPVPDPGVPALPETDTSTPSPSIGHQWTICLCAGLHNSPSPYINKLTGHVSIQVMTHQLSLLFIYPALEGFKILSLQPKGRVERNGLTCCCRLQRL